MRYTTGSLAGNPAGPPGDVPCALYPPPIWTLLRCDRLRGRRHIGMSAILRTDPSIPRAARRAEEGQTMKKAPAFTCLLLDIGGVLLTNGWDHPARMRAAARFKLPEAEMEGRHRQTFETYEEGRITLEEYLRRVVFHRRRPFTAARFRRFMFAQSQPYPVMIDLIRRIKAAHGIKVVVISNEGRELNAYRVSKFKLGGIADIFISSSFIHMRKPDAALYPLALDLAQTPAAQAVYLDNTPMFVQVARAMGIRSILHKDAGSTRAQLASLGLRIDGDAGSPSLRAAPHDGR